jgi:serine phosphatase RsbU (regulator of sigma subunit)/GAF domain-containing protein/CheY-like chemotaxis protein
MTDSDLELTLSNTGSETERILIVDDEDDQVFTLSLALEPEGYEILSAATGAEALDILQKQSVAVALLDINLPDMGGIELLLQIKHIAPDVACIMTTGEKSTDLIIEAVNKGASGYFHKPVEPIDLITSIRDKIERRRLVQENLALLKSLAQASASKTATIRHLRRLQDLTRTVSSTLDIDEVLRAVRNSVIEALGYDRCSIFLVDPEAGDIQGRWGTSRTGEIVDISSTREPLTGDLPLSRVARGEIDYFLTDDWDAYVIEQRGKHPYVDLEGVRAHALLPLTARDRIVGVLSVDNLMSEKPILKEDIDEILPFTYQAAIAIENSSLYKSVQLALESESLKAAELAMLWQVAQAVTSESDLDAVLEVVADWVCKAMSISYFSLMLYKNRQRELEVRTVRGFSESHALYSLFVADESAIGFEVLTEGMTKIVHNLQNIPAPSVRKIAQEVGLHSMLCVPLRVGDETIGLIVLYSQLENRFKESDVRLLTTLTSMAAAAIHNAQFYDRDRRIAETMQRELLSEPPKCIGRFEVGHYYQSALDESRVGGDFYDVVPLPDGRAAFLLADVSGKGLKAAVYTAMSKYMFRAFLVDDPSPGPLVERLNMALCRYTEPGLFITLFYALLDPTTGDLRYANAGHESPIHYMAEHDFPILLDTTGVVLGVDPGAVYVERQTKLNLHDVLLLYTDGVTDARPGDERPEDNGSVIARYHERIRRGEEMLGVQGLQELLTETLKEHPESIVETIYRKVYRFASGLLHDDIALLCIEAVESCEALSDDEENGSDNSD